MVTDSGAVQSVDSSTMPTSNTVPNNNSGGNDSTTQRRISDNRRSNKPIMEKRRRARINNCLNELKGLILDAMKKDPARHSKLEKADILEMTVKHLQTLQKQQAALSAAIDPSVVSKFRAGFGECAAEVSRFPGLEPTVRRRLLQHLATCLNQAKQEPQVQVHILPAGGDAHQTQNVNHGILLANGGGGVQLVQTRLPNGELAFLLPASSATAAAPVAQGNASLPLLVPIPQRTASTASASSSASSNCSDSPEEVDVYEQSSKPLSLVIRKNRPQENTGKMWKPYLP